MEEESELLDSTVETLAELAIGYLGSVGIELPPHVSIDEFKILTREALEASMLILGDYMIEIEATVQYVQQGLKEHNISILKASKLTMRKNLIKSTGTLTP